MNRIKKTIYILVAMTMESTVTIGQTMERKLHDVSVFYGALPFTDRGLWEKKYKSVGIFSAQYIFNTSKRFGIGAVIGYQHYNHRHFDDVANDITGMIVMRANWINKPDFTLYSKAGIGICFMNANDNIIRSYNSCFALQLPSIGMTYNLGKNLYCLGEFSIISSLGMFMFGAEYKF